VRQRDRRQGNGDYPNSNQYIRRETTPLLALETFCRLNRECGCGWQVESNVDFLGRFQVEPRPVARGTCFIPGFPIPCSGPAASLVQGGQGWVAACTAEEGARREARNGAPPIRYSLGVLLIVEGHPGSPGQRGNEDLDITAWDRYRCLLNVSSSMQPQ